MREYSYENKWEQLLTPEIVAQLTALHEHKGKQSLFATAKADVLTQLIEIAKIQSTDASNKIEGIFTSDDRLRMLVLEKTVPRTRDEQEIAGYRDVLATIHESYEYIPPKPSLILQLHRDLYKYSGLSIGGRYKNSNNVIAETDAAGVETVRFQPVEAWETGEAMDKLCAAYEKTIDSGKADPLLIIPMFIIDFLCIHPFSDGNGRMSRLLTLLLLYREGYFVGKYISIEKLIERSKETYYEVLQNSSAGWHKGENDYTHFVGYTLGVVLAAYRDFSARVETMIVNGTTKGERVGEIIKDTLGKITKTQILDKCPDISQVTVQRALAELMKNGDIIKIGGGRYSAYIWNREKKQ